MLGDILSRSLSKKSKQIQKNYNSPVFWWNQIKTFCIFPLHRATNRRQKWTRVVDQDWDTLLLLDACRADLFHEVVDESRFDSVQTRNSGASATREWVQRQFAGWAQSDIVYLTANPVVSEFVPTAFHHFEEVWQDHFDEELGTVPPGIMSDIAREFRSEYPDKKLLVHYNQPHIPFIQDQELRYNSGDPGPNQVWHALRKGIEEYDDIWEAYTANLESVLEEVIPLAESFSGKTVITSDHGNLLGERIWPIPLRQYGHPPGLRHPALVQVPYAVINSGNSEETGEKSFDVGSQLEALGYKSE